MLVGTGNSFADEMKEIFITNKIIYKANEHGMARDPGQSFGVLKDKQARNDLNSIHRLTF
jgi:hypothetical protein